MQDQVKADRDRLIVECDELRARVDYLESAIKLGGAAYRAARLGLGAPPVELDDYLGLKERAEKAEADAACMSVERDRARGERDMARDAVEALKERAENAECDLYELRERVHADARSASRPVNELIKDVEAMRERAERAEAEAVQARHDLTKERASHSSTQAQLERYDAAVDDEFNEVFDELDRIRAERDTWIDEAKRRREDAAELRAKVTRQRRELRRLNRDVALLRDSKPTSKTEEKPAEDRVVRLGDLWMRVHGPTFTVASFYYEGGTRWACDRDGEGIMMVAPDGTPCRQDWHRVAGGVAPSINATTALARLREIADYHADRGGTDLDRALRSVGR